MLYFSVDISGFTRLSGRLTADELKYHCNAGHFGLLLGVISRHGGDVLKFLGDAFFVLWPCATDASDAAKACNAWRAARCAVDVMRSCATTAEMVQMPCLCDSTAAWASVGSTFMWSVLVIGGS